MSDKKTKRPPPPPNDDPPKEVKEVRPSPPAPPEQPKGSPHAPKDWRTGAQVGKLIGLSSQQVWARHKEMGLVVGKAWIKYNLTNVYWKPSVDAATGQTRKARPTQAPPAKTDPASTPTAILPPPIPPPHDDPVRFRSKVVNLVEDLDLGLHTEGYVIARIRELSKPTPASA